jgi:hypothetical protein
LVCGGRRGRVIALGNKVMSILDSATIKGDRGERDMWVRRVRYRSDG